MLEGFSGLGMHLGNLWRLSPAKTVIGEALPWTFGLLLSSTLIAWVLGNFVGLLAGWRPNRPFSRVLEAISIILYPIPYYIMALVLSILFSYIWTIFPLTTSIQGAPWTFAFVQSVVWNSILHEVGSYWGASCGIVADPFVRMEGWHKDYVRPNGMPASSNQARYVDDKLSILIDKLRVVSSDDPQVVPLGIEILKELVTGLPAIEMFGTSKFVPVNETYWTNYPTAKNYYEGPWWWWSNFKFIVARIEPKTK